VIVQFHWCHCYQNSNVKQLSNICVCKAVSCWNLDFCYYIPWAIQKASLESDSLFSEKWANSCDQALLLAKIGNNFKNIYKSTRAIFFFGAPYAGMNVNELTDMIQDTAPGDDSSRVNFVKQLSANSSFLYTLREDITYLLDATSGIEIISFYETMPIRALVKVRSLLLTPKII
jgi:hypothetical protein